jgi:tetratricopeptide (TPR) repeat protein
MKEMLDICKERYRNSPADLEEIEKFCTTYEKDKNAINWYTKSNFIHRILNAALRTGNIDYLYYFRFFISDLCEQLKQERLRHPDNLILYRGQRITKSEIDRFKQNIGSFIAINGFLSTSRNRAIATIFLRQRLSELSPIQSVLFEITTDSSVKSVIYADIQHLSEITDECEVLFTLSSVFQLKEVYFDDKVLKVWIIKMTLRNEKSTLVQKYINAVRNEYKELSTDVIYPHLLITMDELAKAESYINRMISTTAENTLENAALLVEMGYIHIRRHEYKKAQEVFNRAYATRKELLRENDTLIARSLNDLAAVFSFVSNIEEAIECNKKALSIDKEALKTEHVSVSKDLIFLGQNYEAIGKLDKALAYFDKALQMQKRLFGLRTEHPNIATTLLNIGLIHTKKSDYQYARSCFMEALRIYENTLPCGHDQTIKLFLAIVDSYIGKKDFRSASEFCDTKLKQYQSNLGSSHPCMGKIRKLMGYIAFKNDNYEDAFILFEEALQLLKGYKEYENESILDCLKYLAETEKYRNNYDTALIYLGKAYKIQLNIYLPNQPQNAHTLRQVGLIHMHFKIYDRARKYLNNALEMFGINFKNDHDDVKTTLEHLRRVNQILRKY